MNNALLTNFILLLSKKGFSINYVKFKVDNISDSCRSRPFTIIPDRIIKAKKNGFCYYFSYNDCSLELINGVHHKQIKESGEIDFTEIVGVDYSWCSKHILNLNMPKRAVDNVCMLHEHNEHNCAIAIRRSYEFLNQSYSLESKIAFQSKKNLYGMSAYGGSIDYCVHSICLEIIDELFEHRSLKHCYDKEKNCLIFKSGVIQLGDNNYVCS